ncbi:MAG TPA: VWA domain-containing protein [Chitinophagales bacterium]
MKSWLKFVWLICMPMIGVAQNPTLKEAVQQEAQPVNVLLVLDASLSMQKEWGNGTKWTTALNVISDVADSVAIYQNVKFGLRLFGHLFDNAEKNCKDTRLELPLGRYNKNRVLNKLKDVKPKGITPIAYSLEKSAGDFSQATEGKNILILITDGEEVCGGDPCKVSIDLQQKGIVLKPYVIGIELSGVAKNMFTCVGELVNTNNGNEFATALKKMVMDAIARTSLQVNLLDAEQLPRETAVPLTFYDSKTQIAKYDFYHTLNAYGNPDTIVISPYFNYDIQVHTIPERWIRNVHLEKDLHNTVETQAAQGQLTFRLQGAVSKSALIDRIKCLVHEKDSVNFVSAQRVNTDVRYLIGKYDLEILTLPPILLKDVAVEPNKKTEISVPAPSIVTISKNTQMYGAIFVKDNETLTKIYDINQTPAQETIALQPGKYRVIYRAKAAKSVNNSLNKDFDVVSGGSLFLKL